jgi:hypothetical protein
MNTVDFKTSAYFPWHITFGGVFLFGLGLAVLNLNVLVALALIIVGLVIITTHYRLQVDLDNKTYHDYLWIAGFKNGEKGVFHQIEYLFINKSKVKETMQLRVASSAIQREVFNGYLKFSEQDKVHLLTLDSKESLIKKIKGIASQLKVDVVDYSEGEARII